MYNKHNLAIHKVASKSTIRPEMATVAFYGNRTVATDSFRLIEISASGVAHDPILIGKDHVARLKLKGKETVGETSFPDGVVDGNYPDIDALYEKHKDRTSTSIIINGAYLAEVLSIVSKLDKFSRVTLSFGEGICDPIIITAESKDGTQTAKALLMPIK